MSDPRPSDKHYRNRTREARTRTADAPERAHRRELLVLFVVVAVTLMGAAVVVALLA